VAVDESSSAVQLRREMEQIVAMQSDMAAIATT
jgi:hypothetical protein